MERGNYFLTIPIAMHLFCHTKQGHLFSVKGDKSPMLFLNREKNPDHHAKGGNALTPNVFRILSIEKV